MQSNGTTVETDRVFALARLALIRQDEERYGVFLCARCESTFAQSVDPYAFCPYCRRRVLVEDDLIYELVPKKSKKPVPVTS
jgi:DNA-directed RNA polymerase subunit RPC12/RpoP